MLCIVEQLEATGRGILLRRETFPRLSMRNPVHNGERASLSCPAGEST